MDNESRQIALENEVLHAPKNNSPLFYNSDFDLGKHLEVPEELAQPGSEHFTLAKMNVATKNMSVPDMPPKQNKRSFLFIK